MDFIDQRSRITDQKHRTSNDLFIDHYSLVIERSACANEIIYCGYPDNSRVSTDIGTGVNDPETKLYYVRNRTYNLVLGRWIQRDPIRYKDAENLYEYAASHRTTDRDTSGEELAEFVSGGGTFSVEMQEDPFYKWHTDNQIVFHPSKKATECCREIMFVHYVEARYRTVFGGPTTRGWHVDDGGTGRHYGGVWPYYAQQFPWKTGGKWGASAWDTPYPDGSTVQVESWRDYAVCTDPVKGRKPVSYGKQQCKNNFVFFDEKAGMIKSVNGLTRSTIRCRRHPFTVANVRFAGNQSRTPISNCTIV